jgi:hypothetical protein
LTGERLAAVGVRRSVPGKVGVEAGRADEAERRKQVRSLPCAYLARAALERPDLFSTLGLISPTGFDAHLSRHLMRPSVENRSGRSKAARAR